MKYMIAISLVLLLAGCGSSETAVTAAAVAKSEAQSAKAAERDKQHIVKQLNQINRQQEQRLKAAQAQ